MCIYVSECVWVCQAVSMMVIGVGLYIEFSVLISDVYDATAYVGDDAVGEARFDDDDDDDDDEDDEEAADDDDDDA
jgi:hypothetical protein